MRRARNRMRRPRARPRAAPWCILALCAVAVVALFAAAPARADEGEPPPVMTAEDVAANVRRASALPDGHYGFRQEVELRWLLAKWYFHSDVERVGDSFDIRTVGAPSIVPRDISGALIEVSGELDRFHLTLERVEVLEDGISQYVISGERRPEYTTGAEGGRIWVREDTWLITRMEIRYPWGRLDIEQDHQIIEGYAFPRRQVVRVSPLGASMTVDYKEFWFAE